MRAPGRTPGRSRRRSRRRVSSAPEDGDAGSTGARASSRATCAATICVAGSKKARSTSVGPAARSVRTIRPAMAGSAPGVGTQSPARVQSGTPARARCRRCPSRSSAVRSADSSDVRPVPSSTVRSNSGRTWRTPAASTSAAKRHDTISPSAPCRSARMPIRPSFAGRSRTRAPNRLGTSVAPPAARPSCAKRSQGIRSLMTEVAAELRRGGAVRPRGRRVESRAAWT